MLYRCISVRPFLHGNGRGTRNGWDLRAMREPMCTQLRTRNSRTTTRATVGTHAFSIVWWLNSLISQIPARTMPRGMRRRVQQPLADRADLYCPDSCTVVPSLSVTKLSNLNVFFSCATTCANIYYLTLSFFLLQKFVSNLRLNRKSRIKNKTSH